MDAEFDKLYEIGAHTLTDFAVEARYPTIYEIPQEIAREAIEIAKLVMNFVLNKLQIKDVP
ncbi:HEPN domain-containing protein [Pyrococcus kukulkanii]|uniref:HEPN domain-containing protein n=1 Tax=Pyrococcus kukulkanii TaxID=1609559 RepID=UPI003564A288